MLKNLTQGRDVKKLTKYPEHAVPESESVTDGLRGLF